MRKVIVAAAASLCLSLGASAQAAEFVTNGNFTNLTSGLGQLGFNTDAVGWTSAAPDASYNFVFDNGNTPVGGQFGAVTLWTQANGGASAWDGANLGPGNFVAIDGAFHSGPITQNITGLTIGETYHLTFNYAFAQQFAFDGATTQNLTVSLGGFSATTSDIVLPNHDFSGWSTASFDIVATATEQLLSFSSLASPQLPPFALVSNVSLTNGGGVPEPGTWAIMLLGFAGLGAAARMRRRITA